MVELLPFLGFGRGGFEGLGFGLFALDDGLVLHWLWTCFGCCCRLRWQHLWHLLTRQLLLLHHLSPTIKRLWHHILIRKTQIHHHISSSLLRIVVIASTSAVQVVVSFEPLDELKIVLIFGLGEFLDVNMPFDSCLVESILENFQVVDKLIIVLGLPVDLAHGHLARVNDVDDLAVDGACAELLDFGDV